MTKLESHDRDQVAKIVVIAALTVFALIVAYNNVFDYNFDACYIGFRQPA